MKISGNGNPAQCAANLLMTVRGEVPYERIKGLATELIDMPSSRAEGYLNEEIRWLFETYEPRVRLNYSRLVADAAALGAFVISVGVTVYPEGAPGRLGLGVSPYDTELTLFVTSDGMVLRDSNYLDFAVAEG